MGVTHWHTDFDIIFIVIMFIKTFDKHYWDEDDIEIGNPINCDVVVNHTVILTEEEKEQARKEAIERVHNEAYNKMRQPVKKVKKVSLVPQQPSLFDF